MVFIGVSYGLLGRFFLDLDLDKQRKWKKKVFILKINLPFLWGSFFLLSFFLSFFESFFDFDDFLWVFSSSYFKFIKDLCKILFTFFFFYISLEAFFFFHFFLRFCLVLVRSIYSMN